MATDANGNPLPVIDPNLAAILNAAGSMPPTTAWPRPRKASDVDIPPVAVPPNTDAASADPTEVPYAEKGAAPYKYGGAPASVLYPPAPSATTLPTTQTAPETPSSPNAPPIPRSLAFSKWNLTQPTWEQSTSDPLSGGAVKPGFGAYMQASSDPVTGLPTAGGPQTKLGKVLSILRGAGLGAAIGSTQPTFGRGLMAANEFENEQARQRQQLQMGGLQAMMARQQLALAPQEMQLRQAQLQAELENLPLQQKLLAAQAEAANYKEDPNLGLIDLRTGQPAVAGGAALAPLTPEEAQVLGKNPGDRVPLKLKNTASEIAARGHTTLNTEEGVYDYNHITGETRRMGSSPRMISMNIPKPVYDKQMKTQTMKTPEQIAAEPDRYASTQADVDLPMIKQTVKEFASTKAGTAGGNALAFNTAIGHLGMLWDAIQALNNKQIPAFNSLAQKYAQETGSSVPTNFNTIRGAVNAEVAKVFKGGVPTDADIQNEDRNASVASSPQQLRDNVRLLIGLMNSRLGALQDRYQSIMHEPNEDLINKESQRVLQKIQGSGGGMTPKKVGEPFMQGGQKWIADEVDQNGKPTKAHPAQ